MFRNARVLITGDLGFVGSYFARELVRREAKVTGLDVKRGPAPVSSMTHLHQDCREFFKADYDFDLVIHAAAIVGGRKTIDGDPLAVASNLAIDSDFFRWCMRNEPRHAVYFSSSAAYPVAYQSDLTAPVRLHEELNFNLDLVLRPDQTYGWSKVTGEMLAEYLRDNSNTKLHVFRPFSGYGEGQDMDYPFPNLARLAAERIDPFPVWSDTVRDFIHIDDIVQAVLTVVMADYQRPVNLCSGNGVSFSQLARMMAEQEGYTPTVEVINGMPTGVACRIGDPNRMLEFYTPRVSLDEGIDRMLRHVKEQLLPRQRSAQHDEARQP